MRTRPDCNVLLLSAVTLPLIFGLTSFLHAEEKEKPEAEAPPNERAAPEVLEKKREAPKPSRVEQVTFLGVAPVEVSPGVRAQLDLPPGAGIAVGEVLPDSPADRAGLKEHDVITRLDDQILLLPEQLQMLVRMKKPGDEITIAYIRKSKESTVKVKLASHRFYPEVTSPDRDDFETVPPGAKRFQPPFDRHSWQDHWRELEKEWPEAFKKWWDEHGDEWRGQIENWGDRWREEWEKQLKDPNALGPQLRKKLEEARKNPGFGAGHFGFVQQQVTIVDEDGTLKISMRDGKKHVTATDPDGELIFEGFCETSEERRKVPANLLEKIDGVDIDVRFDWPRDFVKPDTDSKERVKPRRPAPKRKGGVSGGEDPV